MVDQAHFEHTQHFSFVVNLSIKCGRQCRISISIWKGDETMIKLYDFKSSPNCQRVKVVLAEKNLPYEIVPIDLRKQEQKTPEYLKLNPDGKVPVLVDDGTV